MSEITMKSYGQLVKFIKGKAPSSLHPDTVLTILKPVNGTMRDYACVGFIQKTISPDKGQLLYFYTDPENLEQYTPTIEDGGIIQ